MMRGMLGEEIGNGKERRARHTYTTLLQFICDPCSDGKHQFPATPICVPVAICMK